MDRRRAPRREIARQRPDATEDDRGGERDGRREGRPSEKIERLSLEGKHGNHGHQPEGDGRADDASQHRDQLEAQLASVRSAYRTSGWEGFLRERIRRAVQSAPGTAFLIAEDYALLGDRKSAIEWLEKAYDHGGHGLAYLTAEPAFDLLRSEPPLPPRRD